MNNFVEQPPCNNSLAKRKLVCGVGVNDADYITNAKIKGKVITCQFYRKWARMLERCYSIKNPTYISCTVCQDWLLFSNFKKWMVEQEWKDLELDKDIKIKDNNIYSPETCLFVPKALNLLLNDSVNSRGQHPQGVYWNKRDKKFKAQITINGKQIHLGYFNTSQEASIAYQVARKSKIEKIIADNLYPTATKYLHQHI